jgi:phosphoserine phosphatase RsbU/P
MIIQSIEPVVIAALFVVMIVLSVIVFGSRRKVGELKRTSAEIHQEERSVFDFLHGLGAAFSEGVPAGELHRLIVEGAQAILKADGGALYLVDRSGEHLLPAFLSKGCHPLVPLPANLLSADEMVGNPQAIESFVRLQSVRVGSALLGDACTWAEPRFLRRRGDLPEELIRSGLGSLVLGPLVYRQKLLGVLALSRGAGKDPFSDTKIELFKAIEEQSSFALFNQAIHLAAGEKHALDHDIQIAGEIQKILLPADAPDVEGFEISGRNLPARTLSGDYFDYLAVDEDHVGIAIADVSGKGVPAALIMAMCRSALRSQAPGKRSPSSVLQAVNRQLYPDMKEDMFISMAYVVLNRRSGQALLARAGHDAPLLFRREGALVECLNPKGMAVGIDSGGVFDRFCNDFEFRMESGDTLLLYTDGMTEALDIGGNEFGVQRLREMLATNSGTSASELLQRLSEAVTVFSGNQPQHDDITLIALRKL